VQLGTPAVALICKVLETHRENETVVAAAVETLVASRGEVLAAVLALRNTPVPALLCDVAQILGRRKSREAFPLLVELSTHADDNVAVAAIEALGRLGGPSAVEPLVAALQSGNFFRVFPAISVLGQTGDARAVEPLARLLDSPHYRAEATAALGRTGQLAAVAPLAALLRAHSDETSVRRVATALLDLHTRHTENSDDDGAVATAFQQAQFNDADGAALTRAMDRGDSSERLALACTLAWLGNEAGILSLISLLEADVQTAQASFQALRRLRSGTRADAQLRLALKEGNSARRAALLPLLAGRQSATFRPGSRGGCARTDGRYARSARALRAPWRR
jgi:HEAT repeat protein